MQKKAFWWCVVAALFIFSSRAFSVAQGTTPAAPGRNRSQPSATTVATELRDLVARIQLKVDQGKNTSADLEDDLKGFDNLLAKYAGQKTDDVAEILCTQARLCLQVLGDAPQSRHLILQLKRDFPLTTQGRNADQILNSISRHENGARIRGALVAGSQFPDFSEEDSTRKRLSLSAHKGKVVLVHFWASWSQASVADLPNLLALYEKHHEDGFNIIGVSLDDDQLKLSGFTARYRIPWPQFCDSGRWNNKLAVKYGVNVIPASYLLDRNGMIISKDPSGQRLAEQIALALEKN